MIERILFIGAIVFVGWYFLRPKPAATRMDDAEARAILGVNADADAHIIKAAHRRLIGAVHPDKGGSAELTRRINAARDYLLRPKP